MPDATEEFFDGLDHHDHERLLKKTSGTIRFDLEHDQRVDHWLVTIVNGNVQVSREAREADCVVRTEKVLFERMARGEVKALPAWLRNDITSEGRFRFVVLLERLFHPPVGAHHPRAFARERGQLTREHGPLK